MDAHLFSGHQLPLSLENQWCALLLLRQVPAAFLPNTIARFSSCFNRGCFSCRKKNRKDLEIWSLSGKKSSAFFDSLSLCCACAAPQLPCSAALSLLAGWPQEEPAGICDFLFQLSSSSNLEPGLGCLLPAHSAGREGAQVEWQVWLLTSGYSGAQGWLVQESFNGEPSSQGMCSNPSKVKLRVESSLAHPHWLFHLSLHAAAAPEAGSSREPGRSCGFT